MDWRIKFWGELRKEIARVSTQPLERPPVDEDKILRELPDTTEERGDGMRIQGTSDIVDEVPSDHSTAEAMGVQESLANDHRIEAAFRVGKASNIHQTLYLFCGVV